MGEVSRAQDTTRYVATDGIDTGDCKNINAPCRTIQYAVDVAGGGDLIKVTGGTYDDIHTHPAPDYENPPPGGIITQVLYIDKHITIRGGYARPAFADPPNPETNPTRLDAKERGRVLCICAYSSPSIEGLELSGGDATGLGGGRWGADAGGGLYVHRASPYIDRVTALGNTANIGGGMYFIEGASTVIDSAIYSNTAIGDGGGLFLDLTSATLAGNTIRGNYAASTGGGLYIWYSWPTIDGNFITGNLADRGGGMSMCQGSGSWSNNLVARNWAASKGSGIFIDDSELSFVHTTIAQNEGGDHSGIHIADWFGSSVALTNTILVDHSVGITLAAGNTATLEATLWYSNGSKTDGAGAVQYVGGINLTGDPLFVDPNGWDYHIQAGSPAQNAGANAGVTDDIDGELRDPLPDIGADELPPITSRPSIIYNYPSGGGQTEWYSSDPGAVIDIDFTSLIYDLKDGYYQIEDTEPFELFELSSAGEQEFTSDWQLGWDGLDEGSNEINIIAWNSASISTSHPYKDGETGFLFRKDTIPPGAPDGLQSTSHSTDSCSKARTIDIQWTDSLDASSGLDGYAAAWSTTPGAVLEKTKTIEAGVEQASSPTLTDGIWYYFIRPVDISGVWGDTIRLGPFCVRGRPLVFIPFVMRDHVLGMVTNGDFEFGNTLGWTVSGDAVLPEPRVVGTDSVTGKHHLQLGVPDICRMPNPDAPDNHASVAKQSIYIPDVEGTPVLDFRYRIFTYDHLTWTKGQLGDSLDVYIGGARALRDNYENYPDPAPKCDSLQDSDWRQPDNPWGGDVYPGVLDLSEWKGQSVEVRFELWTRHDGYYNTWAYLDDVRVEIQP